MSEVQEPVPLKSYELISKELLIEALRKDKGPDVELLSWEIIPFTNKGDNYSSIVVSVNVSYRKNKVDSECSYVAKLNPLRPNSFNTEAMEKGYTRETEVLDGVIGGMNYQLEQLGLDPIRTPKLFSRSLEKGREAFVTENLRVQGFKMYDRMKGMDLNHSRFVVKELGKFHASSLLFEESLPTKSILEIMNCREGPFDDMDEDGMEAFEKMFSTSGEAIGNFLKTSDSKYEKCSNWLLKYSHKLMQHFLDGYNPSNNQFEVLIHADCWTNNMLFKYNEDEIPVDFRFVDLQLSTKASATTDLNYFFFTSLNGDFRRKNLNTLITTYYESFSDVFRRAGKEPPFTYLELKQELHDRKIYGMAATMLVLQFTLAQGEDIPDIDTLTDDKLDDFVETQKKTFEKMSKREGPFQDRYIAVFDDMLDTNVFDEE
ncbi:UNVERIFIED_CONTAM: hypothetical protein RMT77_000158 [Armadillidium vulgare]